jgi:gamma-glutamyltranspeptidase/glutathione hydrolase
MRRGPAPLARLQATCGAGAGPDAGAGGWSAAGGLEDRAHNGAGYITPSPRSKAACADREYRYGDPLFVDVGLDELLSDAHVAARVGAIDRERAMPDMPPPLGRHPSNRPPPVSASPVKSDATIEPDTSYCCAVDRWGNAMSATPSDGSWRSPVIPGLGIVPSGRGTQSRPDPRHPSGVAPGKRPRLTPNPAIAVRDDGSVIPFGAPGGDVQVQAMLVFRTPSFRHGHQRRSSSHALRSAPTRSRPTPTCPAAEPRGSPAGGRGASTARRRVRRLQRRAARWAVPLDNRTFLRAGPISSTGLCGSERRQSGGR